MRKLSAFLLFLMVASCSGTAPVTARPRASPLAYDHQAMSPARHVSERIGTPSRGHRRVSHRGWRTITARQHRQFVRSCRADRCARVSRHRSYEGAPPDCRGIAWCGCWLRHQFGMADKALNRAINWAKVGSPASPDDANIFVWGHHVGKALAYNSAKREVLLQSGNDGGGVRTRWRSARGAVAYRRL